MLIWPATRFVAGEDRETAIAAARQLNERGVAVSLDLLGENVKEAGEAAAARDAYIDLLEGIASAGVDSNISIKLTMLGLDIARRLAEENLRAILEAALEHGNWVRIDMEGSPYTQLTLEVFERVWESYRNVGVVLQSMLRRTENDLERALEMGARVRLVKGAYREPPALAFQAKAEVDQAFDRLAERLLDAGNEPAIATHDDARIQHVLEHAARRQIPPDRYEFQMLYGIRSKTLLEMAARGHRMRVYVPYGEAWLPYFTRRLRERKENVTFVLRNLIRR
ncbi:MAG TPA: proline dehydrogenase family protein [Gemmatimonadota bacterium]|nr:proline dehydrogenase family protein [Gemmatimonadota bacterium]